MNKTNEILYTTLDQIAKRLGVCGKTALKWIKNEELPAFKQCEFGPWRITESSLREWINTFEKKHRKKVVNRKC